MESRARLILDMPAEDGAALERYIKKAVANKEKQPHPSYPFARGLRFDRIDIH